MRSQGEVTPLMTAVEQRGQEKVELLLDRGADANAADKRGFTALHRAAELGQLNLVRLLLRRGARPHPEAEGQTPLSLAEGGKEVLLAELLRAGKACWISPALTHRRLVELPKVPPQLLVRPLMHVHHVPRLVIPGRHVPQ